METNCLIQEPKKQKLNEEQGIDGNNKCLSNLPEEVLRHILSFLPTKDAVRTSVLCKSWEYLWTSIPILDLKQSLWWHAKRTIFMNFVDRMLSLRDSSVIKQFNLCFYVARDSSPVSTWISAAVRHNVEDMHIELHDPKEEFSLPYCLFTCKTLKRLHLDMCYTLNLPTTISFSNLKVLIMEHVAFDDDYLTEKFFSGLLVLEELYLSECSWVGLKVLSISAPKLQYLSICDCDVRWSDCQVVIFGGSLKKFCYDGLLFSDYCFYKSLSLEEATIYTDNTSIQIANRMYELVTGLSNVKFLCLSSLVVKVLMYAAELPHMPMFNNLMDLTFLDSSVDLDCLLFLKILQNSPHLKTLKLCGGISLSWDYEEDDMILDPVPPSFLSQLKCIKVDRYRGDKKELHAVKILLKTAVVLEEIVVTCPMYPAKNVEKQENLYKQLIELPRGSQNCKIVLK